MVKNYNVVEERYDKTPSILFKKEDGKIIHLYVHSDTLDDEWEFAKWLTGLLKTYSDEGT